MGSKAIWGSNIVFSDVMGSFKVLENKFKVLL